MRLGGICLHGGTMKDKWDSEEEYSSNNQRGQNHTKIKSNTLMLSRRIQPTWRNLLKFLTIKKQRNPAVQITVGYSSEGDPNVPPQNVLLWHVLCWRQSRPSWLRKNISTSPLTAKSLDREPIPARKLLPKSERLICIANQAFVYQASALPIFLWSAFLPFKAPHLEPLLLLLRMVGKPQLPDYQVASYFYVWNFFFSC